MDLQLQNDVSLVTASSRGLGKASAKALAREGSHVIINGRDEDRLRETREDLLKHAEPGTRVINVPGDIKREETITKLLETCDEEFDRLDHVVTSAGGPPSGSFLKTDDEDWYEAFELLVMSVVRLVRKAEPFLRADGGGTLVHITSRSVKEALDSLVLSNSVRMSVIGLEKTLSRELAPDIRVNAVLPGAHETGRIQI